MTTKTRPRSTSWDAGIVIPIRLRTRDLAALCFLVDIDPASNAAVRLRADLERALTVAVHHVRAAWDRPAAANLVAELQPIERAARDLAVLLHRDRLSDEVRDLLGLDPIIPADGDPEFERIARMAVAASNAIKRLQNQESRGAHHRRRTESLDHVHEVLRRVYRAHATSADDGDEREFVERAMRYLPRSPGGAGRKKKYKTE